MKRGSRQFWHVLQWQLAEARHQRVLWVLPGVAFAVVLSAVVLDSFNFGASEERFFTHVARGALHLAGVLMAALVGPALVQGGLRSGVAAAFFARGVSRRVWLAANLVAVWTVLAWLALLLGAALALVLGWHGHRGALAAGAILVGDLGVLLVLASAAVLFAALFNQATPAALATVGFALAALLAPIIERMAERSEGAGRVFWRLLDWLVPNFAGLAEAPWGVAVLGGLGYGAAWFVLAGVVFSRREL